MSDCSCPQCGSKAYKRNGFTRHGKQNHRCLECGRQFSLEPSATAHLIELNSSLLHALLPSEEEVLAQHRAS